MTDSQFFNPAVVISRTDAQFGALFVRFVRYHYCTYTHCSTYMMQGRGRQDASQGTVWAWHGPARETAREAGQCA